MAFDRIGDQNIYIGGVLALQNSAALQRANITHVVSVLRMRMILSNWMRKPIAGLQHLNIEVDDVEDADLLRHFNTTNAFIQSALDSGGSVLVHCAMGKSRSATVCVAFLCQQKPHELDPDKALELIRQSRPMVEPNEGFRHQLWLYHEMGYPDDIVNHPLYRRWSTKREAEISTAQGRAPEMDLVSFEDDSVLDSDHSTEIKCRRCRRLLATKPVINTHDTESTERCNHIFVHPLSWMRPCLYPNSSEGTDDAPLDGRLICPNPRCGANIGKFAWQGMRCNCGKWVVPGMGLARARVDVIERSSATTGGTGSEQVNGVHSGSTIRLPPHMRRPQ
ncbi:hypothetical protein VTN49DRAFT_3071 [Thermomyces lanuginosus]|uniref:uncharacterized protein n=1 Tax=Thermomyces lanuginosus TaxID=5541 RepID=UPI0037428085